MKTLTKNKKRSIAILGLFTCLALNTNYSQNNLFVNDMNSSNLSSSVEVDSSDIFGDATKSKKDKDGKPKKHKKDKYSGGEKLAENQVIEQELVDQSTGKIVKLRYEDVTVRKVVKDRPGRRTGDDVHLIIEGRSTDVECDTGDCGKLFIPIAFASEAAIDNLGSIDEILQAVKEKQLPKEDVHKEAVATVTKRLKLQKQIDRCEVKLPEDVQTTKARPTRTVLIELEESKKIDNIKTVSLSGDEKTKCLINNMALIEGTDERAREKFLETIFVQISDDIRDGSPEAIKEAIELLDEAYDADYLTSRDRRNLKSLKSAGRTNIKLIDEQERFDEDKERLITGYNDELSEIQAQIDYITRNPQLGNQWEYSQLLNRRYYLEQNFHGEFAQLDRVYKKDVRRLAKSSLRLGKSHKSRRGRRTRTSGRDEYSRDVRRIHQDITRDIRRIVKTPSKIESLIQKDGGVQLRDPSYSPINDVARRDENPAINDPATSHAVFSNEFIQRANSNPNFSVANNQNSAWNRNIRCSNGSVNCEVQPGQFPSGGFN